MKIYDVEIPPDLEIPELDEKSRAEIDALHDEIARDRAERQRQAEMSPYKDWGVPRRQACEPAPAPSAPSINVDALRQLPLHVRAIFAYVLREHVTR